LNPLSHQNQVVCSLPDPAHRSRSHWNAPEPEDEGRPPEAEQGTVLPSGLEERLMPIRPIIDHGRCEAKRECVAVCPNDVFEVRRMDLADFQQLGMLGKLRTTAHRRMTAYAVRAEQCDGCGKCVTSCPENAITLMTTA